MTQPLWGNFTSMVLIKCEVTNTALLFNKRNLYGTTSDQSQSSEELSLPEFQDAHEAGNEGKNEY